MVAVRRLLPARFGAAAFYRHVSSLALGTAASQAVLVVASVVLARIYSPRDFGEYSVVLAVSLIVATAATLRLELAVPLAGDDQEVSAVASAAVWGALAAAAALTAGLTAYALVGGPGFDALGAGAAVWLIPPAVAATGAAAVGRMVQSRRENFHVLSRSAVSSSLLQGLGQIVGGLLGWGALGITGGYVAGRLWLAVVLLRGSGLRRARTPLTWGHTVRRWRRFCFLSTVPAVLNVVGVAAIAPVVALCYGVLVSGLFAYATRILTLPAALVGQAVGAVLYPKLAELERNGADLKSAVVRTVTGLAMLSVPTFGLFLLLGPELFGIAFGDRWRSAGSIAALLAPWLTVSFVSSPISTLMTVKNQLRRLLVISVIETVLRVGALSVGLLGGGPKIGIAAYSLAGTAICLYSVRWSLRLVGSGLRDWLRHHRAFALVTTVGYAAMLAVKGTVPSPAFGLAVALLTVAMIGWAASWLHGNAPGMGSPEGPQRDGRVEMTMAR